MLCLIGLHRWIFRDVRDGNYVETWGWCKNTDCPRFTRPRRVNIDHLPLPTKKESV
jgi:hypothetical protein